MLDKSGAPRYDLAKHFWPLVKGRPLVDVDWIAVIFRWLHVLAAITAVGGTIFMRMALVPAAAGLPDDARASLMEAVRSRWARWVAGSILFLLVSGLYNLMMNIRSYELEGPYHALFGIKFLLALAIFFIASLLTGRSEAAQRFRQNARKWLTVNMTLAVVLVCISGVLKTMPHDPKSPDTPEIEVVE